MFQLLKPVRLCKAFDICRWGNVRFKEFVGNGHVITSGSSTKNFTNTVSGPLGKSNNTNVWCYPFKSLASQMFLLRKNTPLISYVPSLDKKKYIYLNDNTNSVQMQNLKYVLNCITFPLYGIFRFTFKIKICYVQYVTRLSFHCIYYQIGKKGTLCVSWGQTLQKTQLHGQDLIKALGSRPCQ